MRGSASAEVFDAYSTIGIHSFVDGGHARARDLDRSLGARALRTEAPFVEADLEIAQALADHAALSIDNARLLKSAVHELAERELAEQALRKTEHQLRHSQKMEAVGRLAGSVAHDFNNQLSVILGYSISALEEMKEMDPIREDISEIVRAGERASELTRQLLAFSRQQVLAPRVMDLNAAVRDCEKLLRRLLGEDIDLIVRCSRVLSKIRADPGQVEQVLMNLVLNARDAMAQGGKLTIETSDVVLEDSYVVDHVGAASGPHVLLAVSDTGTGMDRETQARIFEPFFTTKELGKGTRSRALDGVRHRQAERRQHLGVQRAGRWHDVQGLFPAGQRRRDRSARRRPVAGHQRHRDDSLGRRPRRGAGSRIAS